MTPKYLFQLKVKFLKKKARQKGQDTELSERRLKKCFARNLPDQLT